MRKMTAIKVTTERGGFTTKIKATATPEQAETTRYNILRDPAVITAQPIYKD